jgi:hypothetical protein
VTGAAGRGAPGRERELAQVMEALRGGGATVVAVTGPTGSGKSYVTARAVAAAEEEGWRFTVYRDGRGVRVGAGTVAADLLDEVAEALGAPASGEPDRRRPLRALADLLVRQTASGPVGVVFDPYLPSPELAQGIRTQLLPAVRSAGQPLALMFVARRDLADELAPDVSVRVAPPGSDNIERTLREVTAGLEPPVDEDEMACYVEAARTNPRLLTSLEAVLPLGSRGRGGQGTGPTTPGSDADGRRSVG